MSEWVQVLWGFTKPFFKQMLKVSAFYLEKQKSFIPKKIFFRPLSISKQKSFVYWPNFQRRFWTLSFNYFHTFNEKASIVFFNSWTSLAFFSLKSENPTWPLFNCTWSRWLCSRKLKISWSFSDFIFSNLCLELNRVWKTFFLSI